MKKNQNGFSAIETLIIIFILGAIGFCGWLVWQAKHNNNDNKTTATKTTSKTDVANKDSTEIKQKAYTNKEYGFTFTYPEDWVLSEDLEDAGRGHLEGNVTVTSPNQTMVVFNLNQGGKGGDCWDESANARTAKVCATRTILSVEQVSKDSSQPVYFYNAQAAQPSSQGGSVLYYVGLQSSHNSSDALQKGSELVDAVNPGVISVKNGYVTIRYSGKDDMSNASKAFLNSKEINEVTSILKTFTVN